MGSVVRIFTVVALLAKGMKPEDAETDVSAKVAAIALTLWKKEGTFRRRTTEATSNFSVALNAGHLQAFQLPLWWPDRFCENRGSREIITCKRLGTSACPLP